MWNRRDVEPAPPPVIAQETAEGGDLTLIWSCTK